MDVSERMGERPSIELSMYDRALMKVLMCFPALASNHIDGIMRVLGYTRNPKYNITRLRQLCGARPNGESEKHLHRRLSETGYLLTSNPYKGVAYGAERGERIRSRVSLYSLTRAGRDALGVREELPHRDTRYNWAYYHQSALLLRSLEAGIPLSMMSPAIDYKRLYCYDPYVPMWFLYRVPRGGGVFDLFCVTFLTSGRSELGPGWSGVIGFVCRTHNRSEDYVVLVPWSWYVSAARELRDRSAYRTYLMPYDMSLEILSNFILHSKDWYVRLLAEYLGVKGFEEAGGLAWFGHEGYIQGCRVYLGEFVSGNLKTLRSLSVGAKQGGFGVPVYCLVTARQYSFKRLLPSFPGLQYVLYESLCERAG
jgi:hypothetical protein